MRRTCAVALWCAMAAPMLGQTSGLTSIYDVIYMANGTLGQGTIQIEFPYYCTGPNGKTISQTAVTVAVVAGVFSAQLQPNDTCNSTYYIATYDLRNQNQNNQQREYWIVRTSATPVSIDEIRRANTPAVPPYQIPVSQIVGTQKGQLIAASATGPFALFAPCADGRTVMYDAASPLGIKCSPNLFIPEDFGDVTGGNASVVGEHAAYSNTNGKQIGRSFFRTTGPAGTVKSYTFPNVNATVLTDAALLTVPQGGTGMSSGISGGLLFFNSPTTMSSSGAFGAGMPIIGGGAGAPPSTGTRSGNTTQFVTTTGPQTAGRCIHTDEFGNHVIAPADCGSGGGGGDGAGGYKADFVDQTTLSIPQTTHLLTACPAEVQIWALTAGVLTKTESYDSVACDDTSLLVTVEFPAAQSGRVYLIPTGGGDGGGGGAGLVAGAPPSSSEPCVPGAAGSARFDASYVYICIATNTWKRSLMNSW